MITLTGCEPLFDAFTAAGLNAKQVIQDMGSIVQNDGVQLSHADVEDWAEQATHRLLQEHRKQLTLITDTLHAVKAMAE